MAVRTLAKDHHRVAESQSKRFSVRRVGLPKAPRKDAAIRIAASFRGAYAPLAGLDGPQSTPLASHPRRNKNSVNSMDAGAPGMRRSHAPLPGPFESTLNRPASDALSVPGCWSRWQSGGLRVLPLSPRRRRNRATVPAATARHSGRQCVRARRPVRRA